MSNNQTNSNPRDIAGLVMSSLFIIIAGIALWDTTNMMDADSYIFPRALAITMIVLNLILIVRNVIGMSSDVVQPEKKGASTVRRVALTIGMLLGCAMMPFLGFLISGVITFLILMVIAMYRKWTTKTMVVYPLIAVATVAGFYLLFSKLLLVPLPIGILFE